ncbi:hypothetical protein R1sor_021259 [Riccia sorocarpa]|uniref:C-terminal of Roc (COR) domain-containing protein n=1 Tax=Riccia sorocarpa TaxID=122646 RepID=A0ABD3GGK5_9MARC
MGSFFDEEDLVRRRLTIAEWKAELHTLLSTLQSNSSLDELNLWVDDVDPELLKVRGELLGQCLEKLQTIKRFYIQIKSGASSTSAYLSELVSGLKRNPNLMIEYLSIVSLRSSSDAIYISEIIRRTTKLQELTFGRCETESWSEDAVGSLASSIAGAIQLNLDNLNFVDSYITKGLLELLRKIFPAETDSGRRYLRYLRNLSLAAVTSGAYRFTKECWEYFPVLVGSNISVVRIKGNVPLSISWWEAFADALKSSPVMSIVISYSENKGSFMNLEAQKHSTGSLKLHSSRHLRSMFRAFASHSTLRTRVFQSLKSSRSITSLDLRGCDLTDVDFEQLRSLLRVNDTIEEVNLGYTAWHNDGKAALIEEALARNKKVATEFSIMKAAGLEFDKAKVGRIFLCGSPYAGKTQLKLRMLRLHGRRSRSASKPGNFFDALLEPLKLLELRRTKGAEVEVLMDNEEGQVSLWDLAGQYMFRALHDLILPRTNQSLIFIFAFSPFLEDSKKDMKKNVYDVFALELEEWLKFVASNCQTGDNEHLPQILVVITHRDLTDKYPKSFECGPGSPVLNIVNSFQSTFQGVVKLVAKVYHVDARAGKDVGSFLDDILGLMDNWIKLHSVPVVCSDLSSALLAHAKRFNALPVWSRSTFHRFCQKYHESLKNVSPEILFTIASYLHDVGRIIIVPEYSGSKNDEPLIIVNPNWCTEAFLGTLITVGNDVRGGEGFSGSTVFTRSSDGFIDERDFQALLEKTLHQMKDEGTERTQLEELLQRLNLCYRCEEGGSVRYFVPFICGELQEKWDLRGRQLRWDDDQTEGCEYLGYRLQCKDTRTTSLNKGVFSRFQINFRQKLMERFGISESDRGISCGLGVLRVMYDGYMVLVESDEINGQHVDIMVKSAHLRTRMEIISFLQEHFLQVLQAFCASSTGCPGITLIVGVLRTSSVRNLVPVQARRAPEHSIALEELKKKFRLSIDVKLQDMGVEVEEESLLNFQHTWPDGERELVKDTLGRQDLTDILSYVREKVMDSEREVQTCSNELHLLLTKLSGESTVCAGKSSFMKRNAEFREVTMEEDAGTSGAGASHSMAGTADTLQISENLQPLARFVGAKFDQVGEKLDVVERKIDHLANLMHSVKAELQQLKTGVLEMQKVMTDVSFSIDKLIGYSISREDHTCPRRPYFSQHDSGFLPGAKAYVLRGQAVRLHFLCEARNQPHVVQDQPGLPLVITEEEMSWVPFISKISLKLISTLISVGVQLIAGVQIDLEVLRFANLDTGERLPMSKELLEYMKRDSGGISVDPTDPRVMQSWSLLQKYLGEKLNHGKYRSTFGLCRVRYRYSSDPYAWIYDACGYGEFIWLSFQVP